jgi:hypothetical protein
MKTDLKKQNVCGLHSSGSEDRQVASSCECNNETSGSIKCEKFPDWLMTHLASRVGQLVRFLNFREVCQ